MAEGDSSNDAGAASSLVPSQAVTSRTSSSTTTTTTERAGKAEGGRGGGARRRNRGRGGRGGGRGGGGNKQGDGDGDDEGKNDVGEAAEGRGGGGRGGGEGEGEGEGEGVQGGRGEGRRRNRRRGRGKKGRRGSDENKEGGDGEVEGENGSGSQRQRGSRTPPPSRGEGGRKGGQGGQGRGSGRGGGRGGRGGRGGDRGGRGGRGGYDDPRYPWRRLIPRGAVDPISLDPLGRLPYPPFALSAAAPYEVIKEWPVPPDKEDGKSKPAEESSNKGKDGGADTGEDAERKRREERHRQIMAEQWGSAYAVSALNSDGDMITNASAAATQRGQGENAKADDANSGDDNKKQTDRRRYLHLYDGRVLAYYLVSQLQFIDPLNRRDLTRPELINLDAYLARHGLGKAGVAEAYDARGVTVSSAGAEGHTDEGRARRLQQEAEALLRSLVADDRGQGGDDYGEEDEAAGGGGGRRGRRNRGRGGGQGRQQEQGRPGSVQASRFQNDFERQYVESERRRDARQNGRSPPRSQHSQPHRHEQQVEDDAGIYDGESGILMIDDDMNPGLRAGVAAAAARRTGGDPNGDYPPLSGDAPPFHYMGGGDLSAYRHEERVKEDAFPALAPSSTSAAPAPSIATGDDGKKPSATATAAGKPTGGGKPSKSLLKIAGTIAPTDPAQVERQRRAREEAQRRAMLANQSFVPPGTQVYQQPIGMEVGAGGGIGGFGGDAGVSDGQAERNRNLASALGVAAAGAGASAGGAANFNSGWARPVDPVVSYDEFGNELFTAHYDDDLIVLAREKMDVLLKLERKWRAFLQDDRAASLPLRPMPRESRRLAHEYAAHWSLKTESFDPEPKRYVHCVKMRDTAAPHPLLSRAARTWRGPGTGGPALPPVPVTSASATAPPASKPQPCISRIPHPPSTQAAGQSTLGGGGSAAAAASAAVREFPHPTEGPRAPLMLRPRSIPHGLNTMATVGGGAPPPPGAMFDLGASSGAVAPPPAGQASNNKEDATGTGTGTGTGTIPRVGSAGRFTSLFEAEGRSRRPKLELAPRTVPLEMPKYDPPPPSSNEKGYDPLAEAKAREAERARAARAKEKKEEARAKVLADAFASDDEEESSDWGKGGAGGKDDASDASSDWGEEGAVFAGEDEE